MHEKDIATQRVEYKASRRSLDRLVRRRRVMSPNANTTQEAKIKGLILTSINCKHRILSDDLH
jgi:hypothetical protein